MKRVSQNMLASHGKQVCCVIRYKRIAPDMSEAIGRKLSLEVHRAAMDGVTHFATSMACGSDFLFAEAVGTLKKSGARIALEAVLPYRSHAQCKNPRFRELLPQCDLVGVYRETYGPDTYAMLTRYMAERSDRVIVLYDSNRNDLAYDALCYARSLGKETVVIRAER